MRWERRGFTSSEVPSNILFWETRKFEHKILTLGDAKEDSRRIPEAATCLLGNEDEDKEVSRQAIALSEENEEELLRQAITLSLEMWHC